METWLCTRCGTISGEIPEAEQREFAAGFFDVAVDEITPEDVAEAISSCHGCGHVAWLVLAPLAPDGTPLVNTGGTSSPNVDYRALKLRALRHRRRRGPRNRAHCSLGNEPGKMTTRRR